MPPLVVILGPTASGKSALALEIARRLDAAILAADSMTVYRGMDVGTAKPSAADRAVVPHYGLDLVDPDQTFTVARWLEAADAAIDAVCRRGGRRLVVVGGTPLYLKALFHGLFDGPPADAGFRASLEPVGDDELHARLAAVDPPAASRIHRHDRKRLVRALETFHATGRPLSQLQTQWDSPAEPRYPSVRFRPDWDRDALNRRINARAREMIAGGWVEEVRGLLGRFGRLSPTAGEAAGYKILSQHLADPGRLPLDDALEQIKIRTRQLARRQTTWFRRFPPVISLPPITGDASVSENADTVLQHL